MGGTLHASRWHLYVICMVPYDLVGGTLNYGVELHMLVGGTFMLLRWYLMSWWMVPFFIWGVLYVLVGGTFVMVHLSW